MRFLFLLAFLYLFQNPISAQKPDSVRIFVGSALNIMQQHSMYAKNVDWNTVRDSAQLLSSGAKTYSDAAPAVQYAFNKLGDKHGWVVMNDSDYHNPAFPHDDSRITPEMKEAAQHFGGKVFSKRLGDFAYLNLPFFGGQTGVSMNRFAQQLQDSLCAVMPGAKGLIIDLRLNGGGNMFPMLVGVSNVLGNGVVSQSVDASGTITGTTGLENYSFTLLDTIVVKLKKHCGDLTKIPVAVLIGPVTGSSGESVAIAFSTRPNTVLLGEKTAGFTTGNNGYLLPGKNNGIVIGEDFMTDKNGKPYEDGVIPTITVAGDNFRDFEKDKKIQAALKWLRTHN